MSLFNSKEQEKNAKPQTASAPQVQPVHSAPVPPPTPSAESKPANTQWCLRQADRNASDQ